MYQVKVTIPATSTNLGPGLNVLGLALSLHTTIEMLVRSDDQLIINVDSIEALPDDLDNLVMRAATRVFQHFESGPAGLQINIESEIPWDVGLGSHTALIVGGIVAANNLINGDLKRQELIRMAHAMGADYPSIVAAMYGGLSVCSQRPEQDLAYVSLDVVPLRVVVVLPQLSDYQGDQVGFPGLVSFDDAVFNIGQTALLVEALRTGDFALLAHSMGDRLHQPNYIAQIPAFESVVNAAYEEGAIAVVLSGKGPTLLAMVESFHEEVGNAMAEAFARQDIDTETWIVSVDRQGMLVSVTE